MKRYDVEGRTVLITGGARGIGADAARRLIELGANVALVDRDAVEVDWHADQLGDHAAPFVADVTDTDAIQQAVARARDHFGAIDVVVANAGISGPSRTVASIDPAAFEAVIEINLLGVWRTVRAALPHVVERKGYVLSIASVAALMPVPMLAHYAASKAGVENFMRSLRMELAHTDTRAGTGYFSFIDTDMTRNAVADPAAAQALKGVPGPLRNSLPVESAGKAITRGIERRAKRVYAPRWIPALMAARGLIGAGDLLVARDPRLQKALRLAESEAAEAEQEVAVR